MAMEIDEAIIRVDNHAEIDEVEPIEISDDEARRVRLYENFYQVNAIDPALYAAHDVKRGLRNADGTGVLAGMTNISNVHGYVMSDGEKMPAEGSLRLRGYDLYDLLGDLDPTRRFAFEEVAYLLLMGELPTQERLNRFVEVIDSQRELPDGFTASTLMVDTSPDLMNMMARSILRLYAADESAEDRSPEHEIHTALSLISRLPRIMVLAYYAKQAAFNHESMIMHRFVPGQSTAETRCAAEGAGRLPETYEGLLALPGIGPATAAGVVAFAYQRPAVYLETNVRSVFLHELFPEEEAVSDKVLLPLVEAAAFHPAAAADPRRWYYGLLDYGAHLKATVPNPSRRSAGHSRQSAFEGSRRQKRAWIIRRVLAAPEGVSRAVVLADLNTAEAAAGRPEVEPPLFDSIVADLLAEGFFREENDTLTP